MAGKLGFGILSEHFDVNRVVAASNLTLASALILLTQVTVDHQGMLFAYAAIAGIGFSGASNWSSLTTTPAQAMAGSWLS